MRAMVGDPRHRRALARAPAGSVRGVPLVRPPNARIANGSLRAARCASARRIARPRALTVLEARAAVPRHLLPPLVQRHACLRLPGCRISSRGAEPSRLPAPVGAAVVAAVVVGVLDAPILSASPGIAESIFIEETAPRLLYEILLTVLLHALFKHSLLLISWPRLGIVAPHVATIVDQRLPRTIAKWIFRRRRRST